MAACLRMVFRNQRCRGTPDSCIQPITWVSRPGLLMGLLVIFCNGWYEAYAFTCRVHTARSISNSLSNACASKKRIPCSLLSVIYCPILIRRRYRGMLVLPSLWSYYSRPTETCRGIQPILTSPTMKGYSEWPRLVLAIASNRWFKCYKRELSQMDLDAGLLVIFLTV